MMPYTDIAAPNCTPSKTSLMMVLLKERFFSTMAFAVAGEGQ